MKYENILILQSNLTKETINEEIKRITSYFKNNDIELVSFENLGEKALVYEIKNNKRGLHFQTIFYGNVGEKEKFENFMKQSNNFLKQLTVEIAQTKEIENSENIIIDQVKGLNESFLLKGVAIEVIESIEDRNEDGQNIPLELEEIVDIADKILNHDYFNETMNGIIDNYLDDRYPEKEANETLEE